MAVLSRHLVPKLVLPLVAVALPSVLLYSSLRTLRELDEQRNIYLRHRVSVLVSRLENIGGIEESEIRNLLQSDDRYLLDVRILSRSSEGSSGDLQALWTGQELFRTSTTAGSFRAYVPFHSAGGLRIAQIDLDPAAADFLLIHGRHNVIISGLGGIVLIILSVYSIWSMKRAAQLQVRQLELEHLAHIGTMSAVLAHEIRNPLGTIKGFVQLAEERADAEIGGLLNRAVSETERLESLVKDLLAYGRPSPPQGKLVHWRDVASTAETHAQRLIGERPITVAFDQTTLSWFSDAGLLEQALLNLIRNSVEAIPVEAAGTISIHARRADSGEIAISVRDTGPGFPDSVLARPFQPFATTKASGTGLGLPIARKIATSLAGWLEIRNHPQGGAEANLRFPAQKEQ